MARFIGNSALLNTQQLVRQKEKISRKKVPKWIYPRQLERSYVSDLMTMVDNWKKTMIDLIFPQIDELNAEAATKRPPKASNVKVDSVRLDNWVEKLARLMETYQANIGLDEVRGTQELNFTANEVSQFNNQQWFKITNSVLGVPLLQSEPWLNETIDGFVKENVDLIRDLNESVIQQVGTTINRGIKQGLRNETIKKQLLEGTDLQRGVFLKVETRAALIGRDQVAKLNGQLSQLRQTGVGISRYTWRDSNDERVRAKHSAMDGKLCSWDDEDASLYSDDGGKTWNNRSNIGGVELHPGQDYQCRCWPEPDFSTLSLNIV